MNNRKFGKRVMRNRNFSPQITTHASILSNRYTRQNVYNRLYNDSALQSARKYLKQEEIKKRMKKRGRPKINRNYYLLRVRSKNVFNDLYRHASVRDNKVEEIRKKLSKKYVGKNPLFWVRMERMEEQRKMDEQRRRRRLGLPKTMNYYRFHTRSSKKKKKRRKKNRKVHRRGKTVYTVPRKSSKNFKRRSTPCLGRPPMEDNFFANRRDIRSSTSRKRHSVHIPEPTRRKYENEGSWNVQVVDESDEEEYDDDERPHLTYIEDQKRTKKHRINEVFENLETTTFETLFVK